MLQAAALACGPLGWTPASVPSPSRGHTEPQGHLEDEIEPPLVPTQEQRCRVGAGLCSQAPRVPVFPCFSLVTWTVLVFLGPVGTSGTVTQSPRACCDFGADPFLRCLYNFVLPEGWGAFPMETGGTAREPRWERVVGTLSLSVTEDVTWPSFPGSLGTFNRWAWDLGEDPVGGGPCLLGCPTTVLGSP